MQRGQLDNRFTHLHFSNVNLSDLYNENNVPIVEDEATEAAEYRNFSKWIPKFIEPDEPCTYCRDRKLNCYLSYGKVTCTACVSSVLGSLVQTLGF